MKKPSKCTHCGSTSIRYNKQFGWECNKCGHKHKFGKQTSGFVRYLKTGEERID